MDEIKITRALTALGTFTPHPSAKLVENTVRTVSALNQERMRRSPKTAGPEHTKAPAVAEKQKTKDKGRSL